MRRAAALALFAAAAAVPLFGKPAAAAGLTTAMTPSAAVLEALAAGYGRYAGDSALHCNRNYYQIAV